MYPGTRVPGNQGAKFVPRRKGGPRFHTGRSCVLAPAASQVAPERTQREDVWVWHGSESAAPARRALNGAGLMTASICMVWMIITNVLTTQRVYANDVKDRVCTYQRGQRTEPASDPLASTGDVLCRVAKIRRVCAACIRSWGRSQRSTASRLHLTTSLPAAFTRPIKDLITTRSDGKNSQPPLCGCGDGGDLDSLNGHVWAVQVCSALSYCLSRGFVHHFQQRRSSLITWTTIAWRLEHTAPTP